MGMFLLLGGATFAQTYDELATELKGATDKADIHRLKAQVANAAIARLETEAPSKTAAKKLRAEIVAYCADVQLGTMDVWYGDSVVTWARLKLLDNDWREARSILWSQAEVLQNIENNLAANNIPVSSISPLAGCRYFLGETYRLEYESSGEWGSAVEALKHFYNVYIKYGDSPWGEPARKKADAAKAVVEGKGKRVRIELGGHRKTFASNKFNLGARLVADGGFEEAINPLSDALNFFPESAKSIQALRNLGVAYASIGRHEEALMVAEYLCERFNSDTNAPAAVLGIGRQYIDIENEGRGEQVFNLYLAAFPNDPRRADIFSYFAWKAYKDEDWPEAVARFRSLEETLRAKGETGAALEKAVYIQAVHPADPVRLDRFMAGFPASELVPTALGKKAQALLVAGEFDAAFRTLEELAERYPDAPSAKTALAGLIVAAVEAERFDIAGQVLDRMLQDRQAYGHDVYISTGQGLLSAEQFELALKAFSAVPLNAKRKYVERALFGTASAEFGRGRFEACCEVVEKLLAKYPNSGFFHDARLMQARALVQLGRIDEAIAAYGDVVAGDYAVAFEMAGILADPEAKLAAYQRIALLADPDKLVNRPLVADSILASLPLCMELHRFDLAVGSCDQFEELFPAHDQLPTIVRYRKEAADALAQ